MKRHVFRRIIYASLAMVLVVCLSINSHSLMALLVQASEDEDTGYEEISEREESDDSDYDDIDEEREEPEEETSEPEENTGEEGTEEKPETDEDFDQESTETIKPGDGSSNPEDGEENGENSGDGSEGNPEDGETNPEDGEEAESKPDETEEGTEETEETEEETSVLILEPAINFSFAPDTEYIDVVTYDSAEKDAILLAGVSAQDENGEAVTDIHIENDGDFNIENAGDGQPFTITYQAVHAGNQQVFSASREVYVIDTAMIAPFGLYDNVTTLQGLQAALLQAPAGQVITLSETIYIDNIANVVFNAAKANAAQPVVVKYAGAADSRHLVVSGKSTVIFGHVVLEGNRNARIAGGGILIEENSNVILRSPIIKNVLYANGGAIYVKEGAKLNLDAPNITENEAAVSGGGIYVDNSQLIISKNAYIDKNVAGRDGGGMYFAENNGSEIESFISGFAEINYNKAGYLGGGIYIGAGNALGASDTEVGYNEADTGGGIYVSGTIRMDKGSGTNNNTAANRGGGAYVTQQGKMYPMGSNISANKGLDGGGVYNEGFLIIGHDMLMARNSARRDGGAIYNGVRPLFIDGKMDFLMNTATGNGGAIYSKGNITLTNDNGHPYSEMNFNINSAGQSGGAIYLTDFRNLQFTKLTKVTFSSNTASKPHWLEDEAFDYLYNGMTAIQLRVHNNNNIVPHLASGSKYSASGGKPFTVLFNNYDVNYVGSSQESLSVPNIDFGQQAISPVTTTLKRAGNADSQSMKVSVNGVTTFGWSLTARISRPLEQIGAGGRQLPANALVFIDNAGQEKYLTDGVTAYKSVVPGEYSKVLTWDADKGIRLKVNPGDVIKPGAYTTVVEWAISFGP